MQKNDTNFLEDYGKMTGISRLHNGLVK